ncbi:uncharacterized protein PHACADRAFT_251466 [Phanerochaete carnosa HHB-10118-sp]|uniref:DUF6533 domain-containing protein n=1 Tax=Phanerochaete carnosa (strain HHB-10118-sp) TaxID=650164 RepID=K5WF27_PHACS|nr:uncharacterized protein PHACADRAFT_251466 [Phanerochaete carnosa HHB-10118-sp]EKM57684.1 hypothetical protein PHACADRAFT_251466 [Phanerochaete carnosa HHB-10118-sp]
MSGRSDQVLTQLFLQLLVGEYFLGAVASLVVYEFVITMVDEIQMVWKRPITASAMLLGSVRWCMLFSVIFQILPMTPNAAYRNPIYSCTPLNILSFSFTLIGFIQIALFSALRVFAISGRSYAWSLVVFTLSMAPFATNLTVAMTLIYNVVVEPPFGAICTPKPSPFSARTNDILTYITRGSLILADMIVIILTWIKTFGDWRRARSINAKVPLTTCLLRDGENGHSALLTINIAQLLLYNSPTDFSSVGTLVSNMPLVLANRFMINLRMANSEVLDYSTRIAYQLQEPSTEHFRRSTNRLGNIGETLQNVWDDDDPIEEGNGTAEVDGTQLS